MIKKILILVLMSQLATTSWVQASDPDPNDDVGKECTKGNKNKWKDATPSPCLDDPQGGCHSAGEIDFGTPDQCCQPAAPGSGGSGCSGPGCKKAKLNNEAVTGKECKTRVNDDTATYPDGMECYAVEVTMDTERVQCE